ncbi:unnamed protein product [Rotaria sp. Silwood2]|nr:unnamed protein product [Rotaria sp. Silwood2]CAF4100475.1 unnamed protein product [Rotaria sp. Silwood2]
MGKISGKTHKFVRGNVLSDGTCLYWSALKVFNQPLLEQYNEDLRIHTANYIRNHKEIHYTISNRGTVDEYCSAIEEGKLWGGDLELQVLSNIYNTIICLISVTECNGAKFVWSLFYGENNSLATTYVCMLHDVQQGHYDPLYVMNIKNTNEKETIFDRNDNTIKELLADFIRKELKYDDYVKLDSMASVNVNEVSCAMNDLNDTEIISNSVLQNLPTKRKLDDHDIIIFGEDNERQLPIEISKEYYLSNKRTKSVEDASSHISKYYDNDMNSINFIECLQIDMPNDMSDLVMNKNSIAECSKILNKKDQKEKKNCNKESTKQVDDDIQNYDSKSSESKLST